MKATTVRIDEDVLSRIDGMAAAMSRSRAWIIKSAIESFLDYEEWFVREVQSGLDEVDRGEIATHEDVIDRFRKWGVDAG